jgi:Cu+-exporting ATPase
MELKPPSVTAYMIAFDDQYQEHIFPVDGKDLKAGDLLLLKAGDQVPADCKILHGEVWITGIAYGAPQIIPALGRVESGTAKVYVTPTDSNI